MVEVIYNTPKNSAKYSGKYIVFDSAKKNPKVLYDSHIALDAYKKAEKIKEKNKIATVIIRVPENENQLVRFCLAE
jgi:hypothetical protein